MEKLLFPEDQMCHECGQLQLFFRISRYGCVYTCPRCHFCLDFSKALVKYAKSLQLGFNHLSFVPHIRLGTSAATGMHKVVQVELDCVKDCLVMSFHHFSSDERDEVLKLLSSVFQPHLEDNAIPLGLFDLLRAELIAIAESLEPTFFLSPPPPLLLEWKARQVHHQADDAEADHHHLLSSIPLPLRKILLPHQLAGIAKVLRLGGRALIGDEMGVGKTLEALGVVSALYAYPLLLVVPSALKIMWASEIEKYLFQQVAVDDVYLIRGSSDALPAGGAVPKVVITSFHMAGVLREMLLAIKWNSIVCDEAHFLRTNISGRDALYTSAVCSVAKTAVHCLFLTGTPATSSPFDLFNILDAITPGLVGATRWDFALRYCHLHFTPHVKVMECVRSTELSSLLQHHFLLRRTKDEVLDLPVKNRIVLRVPDAAARKVSQPSFQIAYASSWRLKWSGITDAVRYCLSKFSSVVCFAHHLDLLEALQSFFVSKAVPFIRIDGGVHPDQRQSLLSDFASGNARVALMGITACAVGLSLATAACAIFCELPPDASWLAQAEDRLHRPGGHLRKEVCIFYVVGVYSPFEERHLYRIQRSFSDCRDIVDAGGGRRAIGDRQGGEVPQRARAPTQEKEGALVQDLRTLELSQEELEGLWFTVSNATGRVHICVTAPLDKPPSPYSIVSYTSFSVEEAHECIRRRAHSVWQPLDRFLSSLYAVSPYQRRMLFRSKSGKWGGSEMETPRTRSVWTSASVSWREAGAHAIRSGKNRRYLCANGTSSELTLVDLQGWGCWYAVERSAASTSYYYGKLFNDLYTFVPTCLHCRAALYLAFPHLVCHPGGVIDLQMDVSIFCDGKCREEFFAKMSSSSLRYAVQRADSGICSACHVDCESLRLELTAASSARGSLSQARRDIIARRHPQLLDFPSLARKVIASPVAGNLWHADHIVPVCLGGGESGLENVQTLCVVCHHLKTHEDVKEWASQNRKTENTKEEPAHVRRSAAVYCDVDEEEGAASVYWDSTRCFVGNRIWSTERAVQRLMAWRSEAAPLLSLVLPQRRVTRSGQTLQ